MKRLLFTTSILALLGANNNVTPGWKLDADGKVELKDGNPVYIDPTGKEMTVGADTVNNVNQEAKKNRERYEAAEMKLKTFEGIDPTKAREAIDKLKDIDLSKLVDSGKLEEVKNQVKNEFTTLIDAKDKEKQTLQATIDGMKIDGVFQNSTFVRDAVAVPSDMFQSLYRNSFKIEADGKVAAYGKDGNRLMSAKRVGEFADPEEALEMLVESHPQKETILKANVGSGSGNEGNGGSRGQGRVMRRPEFEKLNPAQQSEYMQKVSKGEMKLVD